MTIDAMCPREKISDSFTSYYFYQPEFDFFQQPMEELLVSGQINTLSPEDDEDLMEQEDVDGGTIFAIEESEHHSPHSLSEIDFDYEHIFGHSSQPSSASSPNQTTSLYTETNVAPYRIMDAAGMEGVCSGGNSGNGAGAGGAATTSMLEAGDSMYIIASSSDYCPHHQITSWIYDDSQDWNLGTAVWSPPPPPPPPPDPETVGLWTVFAVGQPIIDLSSSISFTELLQDQEQWHEGFGFQFE